VAAHVDPEAPPAVPGVESSMAVLPEPVVSPTRKRGGLLFKVAIAWLGLMAFCAIFGGFLPVTDPHVSTVDTFASPSARHLFGTDASGFDLFARVIYGARMSCLVAVASVTVGIVVGGALGMTAGFLRGKLGGFFMWIVDVLLAFPALVFILALVSFAGARLTTVVTVIAVLAIPGYARVAFGLTLSYSRQNFVFAAQSMGARPMRVLLREVAPNVIVPLASFGALGAAIAIIAEGGLSFLGLSAPGTISWGGMIAAGQQQIYDAPWAALFPMGVMFLTIMALNLVGERLGASLDPREAQI
jgi:peptide/nickel transport system permease protein